MCQVTLTSVFIDADVRRHFWNPLSLSGASPKGEHPSVKKSVAARSAFFPSDFFPSAVRGFLPSGIDPVH